MNKKEQEFLEQIKREAEAVNVPKSLEPKGLENLLQNRPKKFVWKKVHTVAAAACCLLVCGLAYGATRESVYGTNVGSTTVAGSDEGAVSQASGLDTAKSYDDVYKYLEAYMDQMDVSVYDGGRETVESVAEDSAAVEMSEASGGAEIGQQAAAETKTMDAPAMETDPTDHSDTNVRQEGVDEADIAKTDGRYLYTLRDNGRAVAIVDTEDGLKETGQLEVEDDHTIHEFYVKNGKLVLAGDTYQEKKTEGGWYSSISNTFAFTYDVSDPAKPKKEGEVTQSGAYASSRMSDGHLYLFSQYYVDSGSEITLKDRSSYIPVINGGLLPETDIYLPVTKRAHTYEVISSVDLENPGEMKESKAIFTNGGELYVSGQNIYWYENWWNGQGDTSIRRIAYQDGKLTAEASGTVEGYIHDSFCIDEYKGYLRVITTDEDSNHVFVLDNDLEVTGSIRGLAEDERVYSARLMGDVGYFVTYRETDPLFSVDFSDPENPEIIGELKIPGFSEYLHAYGEGQLLGIGMDMDEEGFSTNGVKLSMFDVSDNTDVKEVQKYVMENVYSAGALYDYKAVLIDTERNIIGFSADTGDGEHYYVFAYDEREGFQCLMDEGVNGNTYQPARGVYIGTVLYVVKGNIIEAYSMENYQKIDDLIL